MDRKIGLLFAFAFASAFLTIFACFSWQKLAEKNSVLEKELESLRPKNNIFGDYPVDEKRWIGYCGNGGSCQVYLSHQVSSNGQSYTYWYRVENTGKEKILVHWEILDKIMNGGSTYPNIMEMDPGEYYEITMESDERPVYVEGRAVIFEKEKFEDGYDSYLEDNFNILRSRSDFWGFAGYGQPGPLPPSLLKKTDHYKER